MVLSFFFWKKKKAVKKESNREGRTANAHPANVGNIQVKPATPSHAPATPTTPKITATPMMSTPVVPKMQTPMTPLQRGKNTGKEAATEAEENDEKMAGSTKFVSVKAKLRPAQTKLRKHNVKVGTAEMVDDDIKEITCTDEEQQEIATGLATSPGARAICLPVNEEGNELKHLLCQKEQLDQENEVLKKLFRELHTQMDAQQEQLDLFSAELCELSKKCGAASSESPMVKASCEPEKVDGSDKKKMAACEDTSKLEGKSTAVVECGSKEAKVKKDGSGKGDKGTFATPVAPVQYNMTYRKGIPRYTPILTPKVGDASATPDGAAEKKAKHKCNKSNG